MLKIFHHLKTVHTHRKNVRKLCFKCGLYKQGLLHDFSKYSPAEFIPSVHYWTGDKSPLDNQIADIGYSTAWLHHKGHNKHHYEYWIDQSHGDPAIICNMPLKYIAEMFCDRVAACKVYLGDKYTIHAALDYALSKKDREEQLMSHDTYQTLILWLNILANDGEDFVCQYIKSRLRAARTV
jgi:hypothetical protein